MPLNESPAPVTLPDGYHLENFFTLINYVAANYADLLDDADQEFLHRFPQLSRTAQSLYVRLLMRKGPLFRADKLNYNDIPDTEAALSELQQAEFVALNPVAEPAQLLNLLLKAELSQLAKTAGIRHVQQRKEALIAMLTEQLTADAIYQRVSDQLLWVHRQQERVVRRFKLLFFGNARQDFSEFITTQLGIIRYEDYPIDHAHRFFRNKERLLLLEALTDIQQWLEEQETLEIPPLIGQIQAVADIKQQASEKDAYIEQKAARMITRMARHLERLSPEQAMDAYQHSVYPPSRERQARWLEKNQQDQAALAMLDQIESTPRHPDEAETVQALRKKLHKKLQLPPPASDNRNRFKERIIRLTRSEELIELQAARYLSEREGLCLPLENQLFCGLFGLFFWDIIFSPKSDAFFNPYQYGPKDLWSDEFYRNRQSAIDERLQQLEGNHWRQTLLTHCRQKQGIANYLVAWPLFDEPMINRLCDHIPATHLRSVFAKMLEHPGYYRNGFPDLILLHDDGYHLWEVKGPTDSLQNNQKRWLTFFEQHDIPAGVVHVEWQTP